MPGLGRFRFLHRAGETSPTVFEFVEGARMTGTAAPNETYAIQRRVNASGTSFVYERQVETNRYGDYGVVVPYSGTYEVANDSHEASADAIDAGAFTGTYRAHFPMDEGSGSSVENTLTGNSYDVEGTEWVDGPRGSALSFEEREDGVYVGDHSIPNGSSFSVAFWINGSIQSNETNFPLALYAQSSRSGSSYGFWSRGTTDFGMAVDGANGKNTKNFGIEQTEFETWTLIVGVVDRESDTLRLYRNQSRVATVDLESGDAVTADQIHIGGQQNGRSPSIQLDDLRIYSRSLTDSEVRNLYTEENDSME
jgi:hypothetical protein